jgi:hypothetical protein
VTAVALPVPLRREDVLHFLGYRGRGVPGPRVEETLGSVLEEARSLIDPRGITRTAEPESAAILGLRARPGASLALGLVTIGFGLERRVSALLENGETTRALLLDAAGSASAEEAADELEARIHAHGPGGGRIGACRIPRRFSPGYGAWPITAQRALFRMLPHEEIEVRLLPSCLMAPRKSISFAVWLSPEKEDDIPEECRSRRCADCDMTTCPYREPASQPERHDHPGEES